MRQIDLFDIPETTTRHDEMEKAAREFHEQQPAVWSLFVEFTKDRLSLGFEHYSADAVMHRVRWETAAGRTGPYGDDGAFKINNNHIAFYARWFMERWPEHDGFFRSREQISKAKEPKHRVYGDPRDA